MIDLDRFLRRPEVEQIVGVSGTMLYKMIRLGKFPKPMKLLGKTSRWSLREVSEWQKQAMEARVPTSVPTSTKVVSGTRPRTETHRISG
jgi:prophage regulatory protein